MQPVWTVLPVRLVSKAWSCSKQSVNNHAKRVTTLMLVAYVKSVILLVLHVLAERSHNVQHVTMDTCYTLPHATQDVSIDTSYKMQSVSFVPLHVPYVHLSLNVQSVALDTSYKIISVLPLVLQVDSQTHLP